MRKEYRDPFRNCLAAASHPSAGHSMYEECKQPFRHRLTYPPLSTPTQPRTVTHADRRSQTHLHRAFRFPPLRSSRLLRLCIHRWRDIVKFHFMTLRLVWHHSTPPQFRPSHPHPTTPRPFDFGWTRFSRLSRSSRRSQRCFRQLVVLPSSSPLNRPTGEVRCTCSS